MRQTSQEIITRLEAYKETMGDEFLGIIEDIADSVTEAPAPAEPDYSGYVKKEEYDELKQKYIDRFMGNNGAADEVTPPIETPPEPEPFNLDDAIKAYSN